MMEANTIACFKVNDREETDVAKALATSLAPVLFCQLYYRNFVICTYQYSKHQEMQIS